MLPGHYTVKGSGVGSKKRNAGIEEKLVAWKVLFFPDTPPGTSIPILFKVVNTTLVFPSPKLPTKAVRDFLQKRGKNWDGKECGYPRDLSRVVFFIALAASFSAPHQILKAQTFLPTGKATVSWLAKVQPSHAGISFWRNKGKATDNPDNDLGFLHTSPSGILTWSPAFLLPS